MKAKELREKNISELQSMLEELLTEQFNLRMQQGSGQSVRPSQLRAVRKDIARVNTVMNEHRVG